MGIFVVASTAKTAFPAKKKDEGGPPMTREKKFESTPTVPHGTHQYSGGIVLP